jgi:hypothetical protein
MAFVDKVGRRSMIIIGNLAMCVTYIVSTVLMAEFPASEDNSGAHWGFIIMTWLFNFCFASMGSLCMSSPFVAHGTQANNLQSLDCAG